MKWKEINKGERKDKSLFFGKINKVGKPLARLIKKKERVQNTSIRNEMGGITTDPTDFKRIMRQYCEQILKMK